MEKLIKLFGRLFMSGRERFLVVVCGCTGTGKSDLGIKIAKHFNGEVISSDSMQIYKALDIATNKVTKEEMQGIPHHIMSFYDPRDSEYNVHRFRDDALCIMERIWENGKLPVIVGGTSYYVEALIYDNYLISSNTTKEDELRAWLESTFITQHELYEHLKKIDPDSACQVHRNNRCRVLRALEIFYATGKTKSEHLLYQRKQHNFMLSRKFGGKLRFRNTLLINLDAETEVLDKRLDNRVEKMLINGLRLELEQFYSEYGGCIGNYGIAQSIGFKEFLPYLALSSELQNSESGEELFRKCCEILKQHTRQYCRKQRNWLYRRILLRSMSREIPECVSLNTSRDFFSKVVPLALDIVQNFILGKDPIVGLDGREYASVLKSLPENAAKTQESLGERDYQHTSNFVHTCIYCDIEIQGEKGWREHLSGRKHRQMKKKKKLKEEKELMLEQKIAS